jgi:adenine-specific DNA glycosylase
VGELLLSRARPNDADRIFAALKSVAPDPQRLLAHDAPIVELTRIGVKDRAPTLVAVADALLSHFDGVVPDDEMDLRMLPGVGDYLCRAVLTFAFGRSQVLVDRTTTRVAGRVVGHDDARRFQLRLDLHQLAGSAGPGPEFNRALLDLGRELCTSERPRCASCPLQSRCATGRSGVIQLELVEAMESQSESAVA